MGDYTALRPLILSDQTSVKRTINEVNSFVAGDVIRFDALLTTYQKAQANGATSAQAIGIVEAANSDSFTVVYQGEIDVSSFFTPLSASDEVFYLSAATAGRLTPSVPTNAGEVIKPMLIQRDDGLGIVVNQLGTLIGGESTVDLSAVQPVGTVAWYCGTTGTIPAQWSLCDGGTLDVATYASYASAIGIVFGYRVQASVTITGINSATPLSTSSDLSSYMVDRVVLQGSTQGYIESATQTGTNQYTITIREYPFFETSRDTPITSSVGDGAATIIIDDAASPHYFTATLSGATLTHVCKPNIKSRFIVGTCYDSDPPREFSTYDLGSLGGKEEHALSIGEMPSHGHAFSGTPQTVSSSSNGDHSHGIAKATSTIAGGGASIQGVAGSGIGTSNEYTTSPASGYVGADPIIQTGGAHQHSVTFTPTGTIGASGGGEAHENRPPYIALHPIVRVKSDGLASILEIASLASLELVDLADVGITGATAGDIIVFNGPSGEFQSFRMFSGKPTDAAVLNVNVAYGRVGVGVDGRSTPAGGILSVKGNTGQFLLIDADAVSTSTGGAHLFETSNGILSIFGASGDGATFFNPTLSVDTYNQAVGIRGTGPSGIFDVRVASGSTCAFNIGTGGHAAFGRTANPAISPHAVSVFGNGLGILGATGNAAGRLLGGLWFGTNAGTGATAAGILGIHGGLSGSANKSSIEFQVNNGSTLATRMALSPDGRLGLGTTGPDSLFQIVGATAQLVIDAGGVRTVLGGTAPTVGTTGAVSFSISTNGTPRIVAGATGYVGIGITGPNADLHVFNSTRAVSRVAGGGATFDVAVSGGSGACLIADGVDLNAYVGGQKRVVVTTGGNVGIGTASPSAKLEVSGAVKSQNTSKLWAKWGEDASGLTGYGVVSATKNGTGSYTIVHNLGTTAYAAFVTPVVNQPIGTTGGLVAFVSSQSGNSFDVQVRDLAGASASTNLTSLSAMIMAF